MSTAKAPQAPSDRICEKQSFDEPLSKWVPFHKAFFEHQNPAVEQYEFIEIIFKYRLYQFVKLTNLRKIFVSLGFMLLLIIQVTLLHCPHLARVPLTVFFYSADTHESCIV